jgi:HSP20 family molecular chaperone IbpA
LIDIPANANFLIPVKLDVDMKYVLQFSLTGFKNEDVLVTVKGTAKVGKGGIYKNFPINYEGRQNLALLVK